MLTCHAACPQLQTGDHLYERPIILLKETCFCAPRQLTRAYFTQKTLESQHMLANAFMRESENLI